MPRKRLSLSIGAPLGNLEGVRLQRLFERIGKYIWVPFLDPEDIKILSLRPPGTLVNGQGSRELISDYGARRTHLYGLGASGPKGSNPMLINQ